MFGNVNTLSCRHLGIHKKDIIASAEDFCVCALLGLSQGPDFGERAYLRDVGRHPNRENLKFFIGFLKF